MHYQQIQDMPSVIFEWEPISSADPRFTDPRDTGLSGGRGSEGDPERRAAKGDRAF